AREPAVSAAGRAIGRRTSLTLVASLILALLALTIVLHGRGTARPQAASAISLVPAPARHTEPNPAIPNLFPPAAAAPEVPAAGPVGSPVPETPGPGGNAGLDTPTIPAVTSPVSPAMRAASPTVPPGPPLRPRRAQPDIPPPGTVGTTRPSD